MKETTSTFSEESYFDDLTYVFFFMPWFKYNFYETKIILICPPQKDNQVTFVLTVEEL